HAARGIDTAHEGEGVLGQSTDEPFAYNAAESVYREYDVGVLARVGRVVSEMRSAQVVGSDIGRNQPEACVVLGMKGRLAIAINAAGGDQRQARLLKRLSERLPGRRVGAVNPSVGFVAELGILPGDAPDVFDRWFSHSHTLLQQSL